MIRIFARHSYICENVPMREVPARTRNGMATSTQLILMDTHTMRNELRFDLTGFFLIGLKEKN